MWPSTNFSIKKNIWQNAYCEVTNGSKRDIVHSIRVSWPITQSIDSIYGKMSVLYFGPEIFFSSSLKWDSTHCQDCIATWPSSKQLKIDQIIATVANPIPETKSALNLFLVCCVIQDLQCIVDPVGNEGNGNINSLIFSLYHMSRNSGYLDSNLEKIMSRYLWIILKNCTFF